MNCEEARQNAAAYVLGALNEEEQAEFERHIAECGEEHGLFSFSQTVERLSEAAPEMEPPADLRDRIMAEAERDLAAGRPAAVTQPVPLAEVSRPQAAAQGVRPWHRRMSMRMYAAAASVLIVFASLLGWNVALQLSHSDSGVLHYLYRRDDGEWMRVETSLGKSGMTLSVGGLDSLAPEQTYQFWAIRNDKWFSIGDFNTNPEGRWSGDFDFQLEEGDSVAITIEPAGGSERPTVEAEIQTRI